MSARTQSLLLLLFGGALLRLATSDALLRFVRPVARPWVLLAGAGFLALAIWGLVASARRPRDHADEGDELVEANDGAGESAHGHSHARGPRAAWLVLAPVIAILVIAPPALGSYSAARVPAVVAKPSSMSFPALHGGDPLRLSLTDFAARAIWDDGRTFTGHTFALTGFVLRAGTGGFMLSRLVITCCAADAHPIDVFIGTSSTAPQPDTWVTVTGSYDGVLASDSTVPVLSARHLVAVGQPANPYDS